MLHILFEISTKSNLTVIGGAVLTTTSILQQRSANYANPLIRIGKILPFHSQETEKKNSTFTIFIPFLLH